jgi:lipopolysaccharide/colanic/teichoic acid biosynthesis glycosyltransferase
MEVTLVPERPRPLGHATLPARYQPASSAAGGSTHNAYAFCFGNTGLTFFPHDAQDLRPPIRLICSPWCESAAKRSFDLACAILALLVLLPCFALIAASIRLTSPGPAIFRQKRVGKQGVEFTIYKFRTMRHAVQGSSRSSHSDHRVTPLGRLLRKYKLDELPQLFNVCRGDMSLVGPRPKLQGHHSIEASFRPGLTGAATIAFSCEERLLRSVSAEQLEEYHRTHITPRKLVLDLNYMARATFASDLVLLCKTLLCTGRYKHLSELDSWQIAAPAQRSRPALVVVSGKRESPSRDDMRRPMRRIRG